MIRIPPITLQPVAGNYTIHRLDPSQDPPRIGKGFCSITHTAEEISVVCLEEIDVPSVESSSNWKCLKVAGPLDLKLVGILHDITSVLKDSDISVYAISTYLTDYLLIPGKSYEKALVVLSSGYKILPE